MTRQFHIVGNCAFCGVPLHRRGARYCIKHNVYNRCGNCPVCGKLLRRPDAKFCTKHRPHSGGEKASNWQGGRIISGGYILIMMPSHSRADKDGYVREHIIVWETTNNKQLPQGWEIHHLNGIRSDNRPVNLVALPSHKHSQVLAAKAKRIQELEAMLNHQALLI